MRTTLQLDPDISTRLDRLRNRRRGALKDLVNEALRLGLDRLENPGGTSPPYEIPIAPGEPLLTDLDDIAEVLAVAEGDGWR